MADDESTDTRRLPWPRAGQRPGVCVMVLGTTSDAGKSWIATALCAWYRRHGYRVAPFKAQNLTHRTRGVVLSHGEVGEMAVAQYVQALACGLAPEPRMSPLLIKPDADVGNKVVVLGRVDDELTAREWRGRSQLLWPVVTRSLDSLRAEYDVVVVEGAGSPAEINLRDSDFVNMRVALYAGAHCLLVSDIDRGGAFAHLYGTWVLLPDEERELVRGFVLNKFRGDSSLLEPGPQLLRDMTGVPVVATIPFLADHGLPSEDDAFSSSLHAVSDGELDSVFERLADGIEEWFSSSA